jgi:hypothetical protein
LILANLLVLRITGQQMQIASIANLLVITHIGIVYLLQFIVGIITPIQHNVNLDMIYTVQIVTVQTPMPITATTKFVRQLGIIVAPFVLPILDQIIDAKHKRTI